MLPGINERDIKMYTNENQRLKMLVLIEKIKETDTAYYKYDSPPFLTDREYDLMMEELKRLEENTGIISSGSPTQRVPGEVLERLKPVTHTKPMLSANKKSINDL